ncbi:glycosyltransferase family 4 protein [Alteromonas sp.]|jgi:glycosyltransferase involved in cell wall biosynthesis|uniref:glycosyltransferase family 4 protein n=1 Tax=Alteromonas sp. TaxID=232 RepID=UPI00257FDADD|nr:glycosyltransferase family 4 protein [Alteromonas sp.]MBR9895063.1 glycosyltransferase [Gammaproteobacteria bacterium]NQY19102.1 glycosyltransferase [Alteromonas sp.]
MENNNPKILVVSPTFPLPLVAGGKIRIFNILKELSKNYDITLLSLFETGVDSRSYLSQLEFLSRIELVPVSQSKTAQIKRLLRYSFHWLLGTPAEVLIKKSPALAAKLNELIKREAFSLVQFEYIQTAQYLTKEIRDKCRTALVAHDISYISQERKAHIARGLAKLFWAREAKLMKQYERGNWAKFNSIYTMSEVDIDYMNSPDTESFTAVIPNGVDTKKLKYQLRSGNRTIVFVGWMRHLPNRDAISWFIDGIWPIIRESVKPVTLKIVGKGLPSEIIQKVNADSAIHYLGYVDDIYEVVQDSTLSIVPIRIGSGSRLKILESMALGTPVVSTTIGCEGIQASSDEVRLVDDPNTFAAEVLALLDNEEERQKLSVNARALVERRYGWESIGRSASELIQQTIER